MAENSKQTKTVALIAGAAAVVVAAVGILLWNSPSSSAPPGQQTVASSLTATDDNGDKWVLELAKGPPLYDSTDSSARAGAPLLIKTDVQIVGRDVSVGLIVEGQAGEMYVPGVQKNGIWQPEPGLTIVDEAGNTLGTGRFKYG